MEYKFATSILLDRHQKCNEKVEGAIFFTGV